MTKQPRRNQLSFLALASLAAPACSSPGDAPPARAGGFPIAAASLSLRWSSIDDQDRLLGPGNDASRRTRVLVAPDDPSLGSPEAALVLIEFADLAAPPARGTMAMLAALHAAHGDALRIVFKPIADPQQPASRLAGLGAVAAAAQGRFWPYHDCLLGIGDELTEEHVLGCADAVGADGERFRADLEAPETIARLTASVAYADRIGVDGTPTFFLNGQVVRGAHPAASFEKAIAIEQGNVSALRAQHQLEDAEVYAQVMRTARAPAAPVADDAACDPQSDVDACDPGAADAE